MMGESSPGLTPFSEIAHRLTVVILLLTLLVRVGWLACFPTNPIAPIDAEGFHLLALNMLTGHGFAIGWSPPFCPTMVRTPLYPLLVAGVYTLVGRDPARVLLIHLLLEVLTTALVLRLGRDLGGRRVGLLAGLLYACNGTTQRYTGYLLSEALLLPMLTASVWLTLRCLRHPTVKKAALAGLFWGFALLTKPNVQFLALFIGGLLTWRMVNGEWRVASSEWRVASSEWRMANYEWRMVSYGSRITNYVLPITNYVLRITNYVLRITNYVLRITNYVLRSAFVFWLSLGLTLFPWLLRNRIVFQRWMLSTAFEDNLARVAVVATLAEVENVRVEPWTETWEYYYERLVAEVSKRYGWLTRPINKNDCMEATRRQIEIARASRDVVNAHLFSYLRAHLRGVLASTLDPGHRLWYHVLTGREWESTGVVADIGVRMRWALEQGAVGDALHALWLERVARPPLSAALLWWGLIAGRLAVWAFGLRGAWHLCYRPWELPVLVGTVAYMLLLPGPISYDRFYLPAIPAVVVLVASAVPLGRHHEGCPPPKMKMG